MLLSLHLRFILSEFLEGVKFPDLKIRADPTARRPSPTPASVRTGEAAKERHATLEQRLEFLEQALGRRDCAGKPRARKPRATAAGAAACFFFFFVCVRARVFLVVTLGERKWLDFFELRFSVYVL